MKHTATYSPEDNKLRLYPAARLDSEEYQRVKATGFVWAPKQALFVAPMWTPEREDLLVEMCGEIGDEDTSLIERAEAKAERLEDLSDRKAEEADRAHAAVSAISDSIPLGQPILVGHHSERHARKDAERIENGMRRAVNCWHASEYWKERAAGAIRHAKSKERPDVRARRIKGLEADQRKQERTIAEAEHAIKLWSTLHDDEATIIKKKDQGASTFLERARFVAGNTNTAPWGVYSGLTAATMTPEEAQRQTLELAERQIAGARRWLEHIENRLAYERAMLADQSGIPTDRKGPEAGGACRCWVSRGRGGWSYIVKVNKVSVTVLDNWGNGGANFRRSVPFTDLKGVMSKAEVEEARAAGRLLECSDKTGFSLLDGGPGDKRPESIRDTCQPKPEEPSAAKFEQIEEQLRAGVQVVTAPNLFPTPPGLADRMAALLHLEAGNRVLEPSAGTGNLLRAAYRASAPLWFALDLVAVEINPWLAQNLRIDPSLTGISRDVIHGDFLAQDGSLGTFDAVLMNPPFDNGADIQHIKHALTFLKPGGRLVALCANGPRQERELKPIVHAHGGTWEPLDADTFKEQGTNVNAVLLSLTA